jgi:hypothetical protein
LQQSQVWLTQEQQNDETENDEAKTSHPFEMKLREFGKQTLPSSVGAASRQWRQLMNPKLLTAAVVLTTAIGSPALAMGPRARSEVVQHQQQRAQIHRNGGFWPGDLAAGVVGGAIGTAGAIATAPFRYDGYANNGYGPYGYGSSFTCRPGSVFIGEDGLRHLCQ